MRSPHRNNRKRRRDHWDIAGVILVVAVFMGIKFTDGWSDIEAKIIDPLTDLVVTREVGPQLEGVASIIDGDTLDLHGKRIRLHGVDAPEARQSCTRNGQSWRCGQQAALALSGHVGGRTIRCEQRDIDQYKRVVAVCYAGNEDINGWMVRSGWAMAYRHYSKDYVADEASARSARRGIWAGEVQPPWDWRRR